MMSIQSRWEKERLHNSAVWASKIKAKVAELGLDVQYPDELLHSRSRLLVTCKHGTFESPVRTFCGKVCCCRIGSNERRILSADTIERMSESQRKSWLKPDRFWANPSKLSNESKRRPDLFYVALKGPLTKVGRIKPSSARKWFLQWDEILQVWELELEISLKLERKVREQFEGCRPLDPLLGKGWTELFEVPPDKMISFIENQLLM